MGDTSIGWTNKTWNPTTGCDHASPGCDHCYAMTLAPRLKAMGARAYQNDGDPRTSGPGFALTEHPDRLLQPLAWRKPSMVFTDSMSDLWHPKVSYEFLVRVYATMALAGQHTFQVLTKRPKRMRSVLSNPGFREDVADEVEQVWGRDKARALPEEFGSGAWWPLPNVWHGVSVESPEYLWRIHELIATPSVIRFLSMEPLLERTEIGWFLQGKVYGDTAHGRGLGGQALTFDPSPIHWVIVGGESGPGARPFDPAWAALIRDDCAAAGVPMFMKQMGTAWARDLGIKGKGENPDTWGGWTFPQEFPTVSRETTVTP